MGAQGRTRSLVIAPIAAIGWLSLAALGAVVKLALFRRYRTPEAVALLWGFGFALFIWAGTLSVGLDEASAIPFAIGSWAAISLFVYLRGAALENPPAARPGEVFRRQKPRPSAQPGLAKARDLHRARVELTDGDVDGAVFYLREAERVAVAQRKLPELLEVRELLSTLPKTPAGERLAWTIEQELLTFPAGELAAVGIHVPTTDEVVESLRHRVGGQPRSRDLDPARQALDEGKVADALFLLAEARRVAVAQRRLDLMLEVYDLVQPLALTSAPAEALARQVEASLRSYP